MHMGHDTRRFRFSVPFSHTHSSLRGISLFCYLVQFFFPYAPCSCWFFLLSFLLSCLDVVNGCNVGWTHPSVMFNSCSGSGDSYGQPLALEGGMEGGAAGGLLRGTSMALKARSCFSPLLSFFFFPSSNPGGISRDCCRCKGLQRCGDGRKAGIERQIQVFNTETCDRWRTRS